MQEGSVAAKIRVLYDGVEIPGLVKFGEVNREKGTIEVPTFGRVNLIQNGVTKMPTVSATYETRRDTKTRKFLEDYYTKNEVKDLTVIMLDAGGVEFARYLWPSTECNKNSQPEVDFANISYAKVDITLLPYDIIPV